MLLTKLMIFVPSPPDCSAICSIVFASIFTVSEDRLDIARSNVLLHQLVGLFLQGAICIHPLLVCFADYVVDGRECGIVVDKRTQEGIRRDNLVEYLNLFVFLDKLLAPFLVAEVP